MKEKKEEEEKEESEGEKDDIGARKGLMMTYMRRQRRRSKLGCYEKEPGATRVAA